MHLPMSWWKKLSFLNPLRISQISGGHYDCDGHSAGGAGTDSAGNRNKAIQEAGQKDYGLTFLAEGNSVQVGEAFCLKFFKYSISFL